MADLECAVLVPDPSLYDRDSNPVRVLSSVERAEEYGRENFSDPSAYRVIEAEDRRE